MLTFKKNPDPKEKVVNILNPVIKEWFFRKFKEFSLPQLYAVTEIHSRKNVLISAPTGGTKTLTAFLSIINELFTLSQNNLLEDRIYCVYVSPLKALNYDIEVNLKTPLKEIEEIYGKKTNIRVAVRTGDTSASEKAQMLRKPPHILITTPESLGIILSSIKFRELLANVEWVIVDEVHALAENKRGSHLSLSLERMQRLNYFSRIGLSATVAPIEEIAKFLVGFDNGQPRDCVIVDVQFVKKMDLKVLSPLPNLINIEYEELHGSLYTLLDQLIQSHKTTLIFTNTRSATERVIHHLKEKFPKHYALMDEKSDYPVIGAHHGSLSKTLRRKIESRLREGRLKAVVSSTSLELGIDIGYIDLVVLLGSPKSVARALQRIGRSGHKLADTTKGRIVVLDRDDLIECSVLLKSAIEKKIDKIHIPRNALDVLAQHIVGITSVEKISVKELFEMIRKSYSYSELDYKDLENTLKYLSGEFSDLEDKRVYAKIWFDRDSGFIGRRGKMSRVIYMTNIGTIPDETAVLVKVGEEVIGKIEESFAEKLKKNDVFVLGGETYKFKFSRGQVVQVEPTIGTPTIPSWFSEMLPLSFDLAMEISSFRRLMEEKFLVGKSREEILEFINDYLYVDKNSANAIYVYFKEQYLYSKIAHDKRIVVEHYNDGKKKYAIFHTLFGRRVNDCLSRAIALVISRMQHVDVEIGITDNGFYIASKKDIQAVKALKVLNSKKLYNVMEAAIENSEILRRRFRHCAVRALMILREYRGYKKRVGRQQVSSMILMNAVRMLGNEFPILKEAKREVLEDVMDIENAEKVIELIESGEIKIVETSSEVPSPFAFNIISEGYLDLLKIENRTSFLRRMHNLVLAKISLKEGKEKIKDILEFEKEDNDSRVEESNNQIKS
ncbi:MAG: ATP-dependent helicase [Candidatus Woesearchaeota archaeon]